MPGKKLQPFTERALIAALPRARTSKTLALGIGDDCAILRPPPGDEMLVTTDFSLEGRHFRRDWHSGRSAGHRCVARGLSDLAAMGAVPLAAFLSLAIPPVFAASPRGRQWIADFFAGLNDLADRHKTPLAGGDTASAPGDAILADIVLLGTAPSGKSLRRSTARPGDHIYVTGALGGAAAELEALSRNPRRFARSPADQAHPHLFPQPRLSVGQALRSRQLATACIDLSDGLSTDLNHLCEASKVFARIDAALLPMHGLTAACTEEVRLDRALNGGEDYELLFTASPGTRVPRSIAGFSLTRIGSVEPERRGASRVTLVAFNGLEQPLQPGGYEHLR